MLANRMMMARKGLGGIDVYTKLMLRMNGTNASTVFTDSSLTPKTVTPYGNAQISTAQSVFGGASGYFDGSSYISIADSEDWNFGSGDFMVDFRVKKFADGTLYRIMGTSDASATLLTRTIEVDIDTNNKVLATFFDTGGAYTNITSAVAIDTSWHHIAAGRAGNTGLLFVDGVMYTGDLTGKTLNNSANPLVIGRLGAYTSQVFHGYLDEFRISKGIARWNANFTPPASEYTT